MVCEVCGASDSLERLRTYKSDWDRCNSCGCFVRHPRARFPLERLAALIPATGGARALKRLLGHKESGVDYYRYYEELLADGSRGKWQSEYAELRARLGSLGISVRNRRVLDISGEPGFFAAEAKKDGASSVTVTAFADNVAQAMQKHLQVETRSYDFNNHALSERVDGHFDFIACRYALGFCESLDHFFGELARVAAADAHVYISVSPPSLAICSRWMFDDYTYLRQYTTDFIRVAAMKHGFQPVHVFDDGSYRFDAGLHWVQRLLTSMYRGMLSPRLRSGGKYHLYQHNLGLLFRRGSAVELPSARAARTAEAIV